MIAADTYRHLTKILAGQPKRTEYVSNAGGKKRYATVISNAHDEILVEMFGNTIIRSKPDTLWLTSCGYHTPSTRDGLQAMTAIESLWVASMPGTWTVRFDGDKGTLFRDGMAFCEDDVWIEAHALRPEDMVDLEGDIIAARWCKRDCEECQERIRDYEFELQVVDQVSEVAGTVTVVFADGDTFTFPSDHWLRVDRKEAPVARAHMDFGPEVEVDSPFGTLWLRAVDADCIRVDCNTNGRTCHINGGEASLSGFFYLQSGRWDLGATSHFSINRRSVQRDGTNAQYRKAREVIGRVCAEWATTPIGKHWLEHAGHVKVNNEALRLEENITTAQRALDDFKQDLANLLGTDIATIEKELRHA
jgi:hypothetical protein